MVGTNRTLAPASLRARRAAGSARCTRLPVGGPGASSGREGCVRSAGGLLDRAPPRAALRAPILAERLEALEIALHATLDEAERVADRLDRAVGLDLELQGHPGPALTEAMERHDARVAGSVDGGPRDALIRLLLGDAGLPALLLAGDLRDPREGGVV